MSRAVPRWQSQTTEQTSRKCNFELSPCFLFRPPKQSAARMRVSCLELAYYHCLFLENVISNPETELISAYLGYFFFEYLKHF